MRRLYSHPKTRFLAVTDSDAISPWGAMAVNRVVPGTGSHTKVEYCLRVLQHELSSITYQEVQIFACFEYIYVLIMLILVAIVIIDSSFLICSGRIIRNQIILLLFLAFLTFLRNYSVTLPLQASPLVGTSIR